MGKPGELAKGNLYRKKNSGYYITCHTGLFLSLIVTPLFKPIFLLMIVPILFQRQNTLEQAGVTFEDRIGPVCCIRPYETTLIKFYLVENRLNQYNLHGG